MPDSYFHTTTFDVEVIVVPTLVLDGGWEVDEGSQYTLGIELINPATDPITELTIDWGSGPIIVTAPSPGTYPLDWGNGITQTSDTTWTATHTYADNGTFAIQVWVTDDYENEVWSYHPPIPGDTNCDGVVDDTDNNMMSPAYSEPGDWGWRDGDFNGDGDVDFDDFVIWAENFGATFAASDGQLTVNNVAPTLMVTGNETADKGLLYTLMLGDIVDPGQTDVVTHYTINWGNGDSDTYTAAQLAALNRQVTHTYTDGHEAHTITVDLVDNDGTYDDVASKDIVVGLTLTWDPDGLDNGVFGGTGTWTDEDAWVDTSTSTRYTWGIDGGSIDADFSGDKVIFPDESGTVTVNGLQSVGSIEFQDDGYTIASGTGTPTITLTGTGGHITTGSGVQSIAPILAGSVGMTKFGSGTLTLTGSNTYAGDTIIDVGTLKIGNVSAMPSGSGKGNVTVDGMLDLNTNSITVNGLSGNGTVTSNATGTITFTVGDNNQSSTFDGTIEDGLGDITLTKTGTGTLILTGENTYSGGTTINGGILQAEAPDALPGYSTSGQVVVNDGGTVSVDIGIHYDNWLEADVDALLSNATFDSGSALGICVTTYDSFTYGNDISGSIGLTKLGEGTVILTGENTYSGVTTISGGTLRAGYGSSGTLGAGDVVIESGATLRFSRNNEVTVDNDISGDGELVHDGYKLILTGDSTHNGGTTINSGTLQLGDGSTDGSVAGNINTSNLTTLVFANASAQTYGGMASGGGMLKKTGAGILTLTGDNTYTGSTTIDVGSTLQVGDGGDSGSLGNGSSTYYTGITNNGSLVFNRNDSFTLEPYIVGTGSLTQQGTGTLIIADDGFENDNHEQNTLIINAGTITELSQISSRLSGEV